MTSPVGSGGASDLPTARFWHVGFPVLTVLLTLSVPALMLTGRNLVLHSTEGLLSEQVTDPAAPGWQAVAEPTPVALVVHRGDNGGLLGVTALARTGTDTGAVVFVPVDTVVAGTAGDRTLAELAGDGDAALRSGVETLLGLSPTDEVVLDAEGWRSVLAGVAPLTVENPDDVYLTGPGDQSVLRFPKGRLTLSAADAASYLELHNPGERDLNRMIRHEAFWRAWLAAVKGSSARPDPDAPQAALIRDVTALAASRVTMATLPVKIVPGAGTINNDVRYALVADRAHEQLARAVPFPVGGPVRRLRIRLLDGVGTLQHGLNAAAALVARGGQIDQIGNASSFGVPRTRLEYADEAHRDEVEALAAALGTGEVVRKPEIDGGMDVIVTLGQDYAVAQPAGPRGTGG